MKQTLIDKLKQYLLLFIYSQLVATLISFPILVFWGLPISIMTFLGNFLFSPILSLFLILSSLIFVTELLWIPNGWLVSILELNTTFLKKLLDLGSKEWLFYFCKPPILISLIFIFLPIVFYKQIMKISLKPRIILLLSICSMFVFSSFVFAKYFSKDSDLKTPKLTILKNKNGKLDIFDKGEFAKKSSPSNYVEYELRPYLAKNFGSVEIDGIYLEKTSERSLDVITFICSFCYVKTIHITYKAFNYKENQAYKNLKKLVDEQSIKIEVLQP